MIDKSLSYKYRAENRKGFFRGAQADTRSGQSMSPGTSASGGSRNGGASHDRGGQQHAAQAAAAQAAAAANRAAEQKAAAEREMRATIAQAESNQREAERSNQLAEARRLMTQPTAVANPLARTPIPLGTVDPYQESYVYPDKIWTDPRSVYETGDYNEIIQGPKIDTEPRKDILPEFVPRKTTTVTGGIPHREDPIQKIVYEPREGPARTYDPRTDPNALLQRGSGIMGTAKDKSIQMAKNFAKQKAMKALGLGALNPFLGVGSWLLNKFAPGIKTKFASKFKAPGTDTKKLVSGDTRDGEGANIQEAITGVKGLLTEGAETLGITEDQREQYKVIQNKMKTALDQGFYTNEQGQVIQLNEQQLDQLQKYIDNLNNILGTVLQTAAHGGRIDGPLMGGSRYI